MFINANCTNDLSNVVQILFKMVVNEISSMQLEIMKSEGANCLLYYSFFPYLNPNKVNGTLLFEHWFFLLFWFLCEWRQHTNNLPKNNARTRSSVQCWVSKREQRMVRRKICASLNTVNEPYTYRNLELWMNHRHQRQIGHIYKM